MKNISIVVFGMILSITMFIVFLPFILSFILFNYLYKTLKRA